MEEPFHVSVVSVAKLVLALAPFDVHESKERYCIYHQLTLLRSYSRRVATVSFGLGVWRLSLSFWLFSHSTFQNCFALIRFQFPLKSSSLATLFEDFDKVLKSHKIVVLSSMDNSMVTMSEPTGALRVAVEGCVSFFQASQSPG